MTSRTTYVVKHPEMTVGRVKKTVHRMDNAVVYSPRVPGVGRPRLDNRGVPATVFACETHDARPRTAITGTRINSYRCPARTTAL